MASLFVIQGIDQGTRYELAGPTQGIGRETTNGVRLRDREVSRNHAEIRQDSGGHLVVDLQSSNGTFVNGQQISRHRLETGDEIQLGNTVLLYTGPDEHSDPHLNTQVQFIHSADEPDASRIVHSISQDEGSRILGQDFPGSESPWLARARSNLQIMYRTALAVSHTLDIDQLLARIMKMIFEWVAADRGCILLCDPNTKKLEPAVRRVRTGVDAAAAITISQTILDYVVSHKECVLTSDAQVDSRWSPTQSIMRQHIKEAMCVPMQGRYDMVGVIYIDTFTPPARYLEMGSTRFNEEHLKLMVAIGHQAALAVEDTRYYSAMVQAERLAAMGQTIAILSHHIKNILQGIRGGSYLIQMGLKDHNEDIVRKGWGMVENRQEQIASLVLDMLTFSKEREPELMEEDINSVVADVIDLMQSRAAECRVQLTLSTDPCMPRTTFDPNGIHRAILNLVTNAIDAAKLPEAPEPSAPEGSPPAENPPHTDTACSSSGEKDAVESAHKPEQKSPLGRVHVSTQYLPQPATVIIRVEDSGPGIPSEDIEKIFTLFVSSKGARGTGLGLPVCDKIIREHGGQVKVTSTPGQGSCFEASFPATLGQTNTEESQTDPLGE